MGDGIEAVSGAELTSAENREGKVVVLSLGFEPMFLGAGGTLSVAWYVRRDILLNLEGRVLNGLSWLTYREHQRSIALQVKTFLSNSLYVAGGGRGRRLELEEWGNDGARDEGARYAVNDLGLDLGLGSEWSWHRTTFGVEWLGGYVQTFEDEARAYPRGSEPQDNRRWAAWDLRALTVSLGIAM